MAEQPTTKPGVDGLATAKSNPSADAGSKAERSPGKSGASGEKAPPNLELLLGTGEGLVARKIIPVKTKVRPDELKAKKPKKSAKLRHLVIGASFVLGVLLPASVVSSYMAFIAADQYSSSTSFSVRSISGAPTGDLLGIFSQASSGNTMTDSFILIDYISSSEMLADVESHFDLAKIFARRGADFFYGMPADLSAEDKLEYWRRMVSATFDHSSGILTLELKAFDPEDARKLTRFVMERSENLINNLSNKARDEVSRSAREELAVAETRLAKARSEVRQYRDVSQEVDPEENAKLAAKLIGGLESRLTELNATLAFAKSQMMEESPRIKVMKAEVSSIEKQITIERQRLGSGTSDQKGADADDVAGRISQYQDLQTEQDFAERAYTSAMAGLEKARVQADEKERYLATFIQPTLSEEAQYPHRLMNSLLAFLGFFFAWGVLVMIYYNIRDRA